MSWSRFFRRRRWDQERARELESYLDIETQENIALGMPPEDARHAANLKLGNRTRIREEIYRMNTLTVLENLWQDVRYGARALAKTPAFTVIVVASLALGIGANTAIFSLIDAALLKMLPVRNPEQLVQLSIINPNIGSNDNFSYDSLNGFRNSQTLAGVLAFRKLHDIDVEVSGHGALAQGQVISGDYFQTLGVRPMLGRLIAPSDETMPGENVAVLGYGYWRQRFALNPNILGLQIVVNNVPFTVVGVTPPEFYGLQPGERIDISLPLPAISRLNEGFAGTNTPYDVFRTPFRTWLYVMARLKPGITSDRELASLVPAFAQSMHRAAESFAGLPFDSPQVRRSFLNTRLVIQPAGQGLAALRRQFSKPLWTIMAVVALLLLVTCANVGNLLLARGNARRREIAVRLTLGAGRRRLLSQLLAEGLLLALSGGAFGLLLALLASRSLVALMSHARSSISLSVQPDSLVLLFTLAVSVFSALLFSLVPALRAIRLQLSSSLVEDTRLMGKAVARSPLAKTLVVAQVAISLVLLCGAALLSRSLANLETFFPGFDKQNLLLLSLDPTTIGYHDPDRLAALYQNLLARFQILPGVRAVSYSVHSPLSPNYSSTPVRIEGQTPRLGQELAPVGIEMVGPNYFSAMRAPLLAGRDFTTADRAGAPKVAAINQTMARFYFGDTNPLGRRISIPGYRGDSSFLEIIAVVHDAKYHDLREQAFPVAYLPVLQAPEFPITFEIRASSHAAALESAVLRAVKSTDSRLPISGVKTFTEQLDDSLIEERLVASLSTMFGVLAAALASIGLYGLMVYAVNRRTSEIGIRMALGARRAQILRMVLGETLLLVIAGVAIGIPAAITASRLIRSQLFGLEPSDPLALFAASFLLMAVAALAGFLPARRAARLDPMLALRHE